jgi:hypothetical protein
MQLTYDDVWAMHYCWLTPILTMIQSRSQEQLRVPAGFVRQEVDTVYFQLPQTLHATSAHQMQ